MRTMNRKCLTFAATGLVGGGIALFGAGSVPAANAQEGDYGICEYRVTARHGLKVHTGPGLRYRVIGTLPYRKEVRADCKKRGWTELRGDVPVELRHGFVDAAHLRLIRVIYPPDGGVAAGAGATSPGTNPYLAGTGLAAIAAGAGVAVMARRRRTAGV